VSTKCQSTKCLSTKRRETVFLTPTGEGPAGSIEPLSRLKEELGRKLMQMTSSGEKNPEPEFLISAGKKSGPRNEGDFPGLDAAEPASLNVSNVSQPSDRYGT
jgi:hypothetical protein